MQGIRSRLAFAACLASLTAAPVLGAQPPAPPGQSAGPDIVWQDPGDVGTLNLFYGAGGEAHEPNQAGTFTFINERLKNATPKFDVRDAQGVRWRVKLANEAKAETAATRLMWAAGYFVDEDYYLESIRVTGMPVLIRGNQYVGADGTVRGARLERQLPGVKRIGTWNWVDNPFRDTTEFHGLCVMMSLVNNWDVSSINNGIVDTGLERRYLVTDMGASFGNAGDSVSESKSNPRDYARSTFIEAATPDFVDFALHSRLFMQAAVTRPYYRQISLANGASKHILRADARWLGHRLSLLSVHQIRDAFRAAGYKPDEIDLYTRVVQSRIAALLAL